MQCTLITYATKPGSREDNAAKVRAVFQELERTAPAGFGYLVLATDSGEFVHVTFSATGDSASLTGLQAFQDFQSGHSARRSGELSRRPCTLVGAYGVPGVQRKEAA